MRLDLPSEHNAYKIVPNIMLSGIKPNALMYMIWARANMHIPGVKQLGQTNSASPMQLNINPVNMRLENLYLKNKTVNRKCLSRNIQFPKLNRIAMFNVKTEIAITVILELPILLNFS